MTQVFSRLAAVILGALVLIIVAGRMSFDASTDFMAYIASRPLATLPLGSGDSIAILQGTTKRFAGTTYGQTDASNTWTKSNAVTSAALTPGATVTVNAGNSNGFTLQISNNSTVLSNPINLIAGQTLDFLLTVASPGFSGFSTGSNYKFAGGTLPSWSTAAGKVDALHCKAWSTAYLECGAVIDVR